MPRTREFDLTEATRDIAEKFWADGYEATGITELVEATGVGRASLYAAFGSKRAMLDRAIDWYLAERIEPLTAPIFGGGLAGVAGMFHRFAWAREHKPDVAQMGCLMVNSIVELGGDDPGVASHADRYRARIVEAFSSALEQAVVEGEIDGDVEQRAETAYLLLMGLYISIKSGAQLEEIQRLCRHAVAVVESWRAA